MELKRGIKDLFLCVIVVMSLLSCAHKLNPYKGSREPGWVSALRTGNTSLKIEQGKSYFFRAIYSGNEPSEVVCEKSLEKNIEFIKKSYPFISQIPMSVEVVYFSDKFKDCSTTLSISKKMVSKLDDLKALKIDYQKTFDQLEKEKNALRVNLEVEEKKRRQLNARIQELSEFIEQNISLEIRAKDLESTAVSIKNKIKKMNRVVYNFAVNGTTQDQFNSILKSAGLTTAYRVRYLYGSYCPSKYQSNHGEWIVCWTRTTYNPIILGFCNLHGKCWSRSHE